MPRAFTHNCDKCTWVATVPHGIPSSPADPAIKEADLYICHAEPEAHIVMRCGPVGSEAKVHRVRPDDPLTQAVPQLLLGLDLGIMMGLVDGDGTIIMQW